MDCPLDHLVVQIILMWQEDVFQMISILAVWISVSKDVLSILEGMEVPTFFDFHIFIKMLSKTIMDLNSGFTCYIIFYLDDNDDRKCWNWAPHLVFGQLWSSPALAPGKWPDSNMTHDRWNIALTWTEAEQIAPEWSKSTLKIWLNLVAFAFMIVLVFPNASSSTLIADNL